jgi:septal ring factor EnvC (AmiA/AmiB activator)
MSAVIGSLRAELSANIAQFQSDMGQAADELKKFGKEAKKLGREIEDVGKSMSLAITLPLVALGREATKKAVDAAQAFSLLQATIKSTGNASGKTAEQLEETAKQLRAISTV